jgi:mitogen-activated protein kinase organizer 1
MSGGFNMFTPDAWMPPRPPVPSSSSSSSSSNGGKRTFQPFGTYRGHARGALLVARFNCDGNYVLSAGKDKAVHLWNPRAHKIEAIKVYEKQHGYEIRDLCVSNDSKTFVSCGGDRDLFQWDVLTGEMTRRLKGHTQAVNAVAFNKNDSVVASASMDRSVKMFDLRSRSSRPIQSLQVGKDGMTGLTIQDTQILCCSSDGTVHTFDVRTGDHIVDSTGTPMTHVAASHDGQCVVVNSMDSTIKLLDRQNGKLLNEYKGHTHSEYTVRCCFSHDDAFVCTGSEDHCAYVYDLVRGDVVDVLRGHEGVVGMVDSHPTKHELLTASADGTAVVWARR